MVNFSTLILTSEVNGPGGLFDFDATLPLVVTQFILLLLILNITLYKPLLSVFNAREKYILAELDWASLLLSRANEVNNCYEQTVNFIRKQDQLAITNSQVIRKQEFDNKLENFQNSINKKLNEILEDLDSKNKKAKESVDNISNSLCTMIETRLFL